MRIIVVSDTHGSYDRLSEVLRRNYRDAEIFIHLGDGLSEFEKLSFDYPQNAFIGVRGNNDPGADAPYEKTVCAAGKKIFITHGHLFGVKHSIEPLLEKGHSEDADIVLFGHTHGAFQDYDDGMYIINPGSLAFSHVTPASYLKLDITPAGIVPVAVRFEE